MKYADLVRHAGNSAETPRDSDRIPREAGQDLYPRNAMQIEQRRKVSVATMSIAPLTMLLGQTIHDR